MGDRKEVESRVDNYGYPLPLDFRRQLRRRVIRIGRSVTTKCIYLVMSAIGALLWLGRRWKSYPALKPQSFHPKRILVIRLDLIGDLVLSLTVARALKRTYPDAEIDLLAIPSSAKVAVNDPHISEIIMYDPNVWRHPRAWLKPKNWRDARALLRRLRARHYDLAVSVYAQWAAVLAVLSGAKRRVGFGPEGYPGFMTDSVAGGIPGRWRHWAPLDDKHEVDYCLELAHAAGATIISSDRIPNLYIDEQSSQAIEQLLHQEGAQQGKPLIVCHVSSNNGQSKRWPLPYWATLSDRLIREENAQVVFTGASNDLPIIEDLIRRMHECPINLASKTSLLQLAALLQRADLVISGDSGPMHMAVAIGAPLIAIHGPTNPSLGGPVGSDATVLRSHIWCSPCYTARAPADCRFATTQCMKNILPSQVFEIAQGKLRETAGNRLKNKKVDRNDEAYIK